MCFEISPKAEIDQILKVLNQYKFCVVVDEKNNCLGTITDGDIRRKLINKNNLENIAINICQKNFQYARDAKKAELMNSDLKFIPILNENNKYISTYIREINNNIEQNFPLIIMAGGKGTRMKTYTKDMPKPLLKIKGIPMIELIIKQAKQSGIKEIYISINYLGHKIKELCKSGEKYNIKIRYIEEEKELGTAGSLGFKRLKDFQNIIVINGDVISDLNLNLLCRFHVLRNNDITLAVKKFSLKNPFGVVKFNGFEYEGIDEKPEYLSYINSGIYVIKSEILKLIIENEKIDMPDLFERARKNRGKLEVYPFESDWNDVGSIEVFERLNL